MRVEVAHRYTYEAPPGTKLGDVLELPDSGMGRWEARVTNLAPSYAGYVKSAIRNLGSELDRAKHRVEYLTLEAKRIRVELKIARTRVELLRDGTPS